MYQPSVESFEQLEIAGKIKTLLFGECRIQVGYCWGYNNVFGATEWHTSSEINIAVTGNGFLHGMVRIIAGTLLEVGRGTRAPLSVQELFGAKRAAAGYMAPPEGLCLMEVFY